MTVTSSCWEFLYLHVSILNKFSALRMLGRVLFCPCWDRSDWPWGCLLHESWVQLCPLVMAWMPRFTSYFRYWVVSIYAHVYCHIYLDGYKNGYYASMFMMHGYQIVIWYLKCRQGDNLDSATNALSGISRKCCYCRSGVTFSSRQLISLFSCTFSVMPTPC